MNEVHKSYNFIVYVLRSERHGLSIFFEKKKMVSTSALCKDITYQVNYRENVSIHFQNILILDKFASRIYTLIIDVMQFKHFNV